MFWLACPLPSSYKFNRSTFFSRSPCFFLSRSTQANTTTQLHNSFAPDLTSSTTNHTSCPLPLSFVDGRLWATTLCIFLSAGCEPRSSRNVLISKYHKPVHSSMPAEPKWIQMTATPSVTGWYSEWAPITVAFYATNSKLIGNIFSPFPFFSAGDLRAGMDVQRWGQLKQAKVFYEWAEETLRIIKVRSQVGTSLCDCQC